MRTLIRKAIQLVQTEFLYSRHKPGRLLFDHLPKCAGTTINHYLLAHYPPRLVFKMQGQHTQESVKEFQSMSQESRYRYELITGHLTNELLDYVHPDTVIATVFRDPIDRILSHYFYVQQNPRHYLHERVAELNINLEGYVSSALSPELRNWYTTHFSGRSIEEAEQQPEQSVSDAAHMILKRYDVIGFQDDLPTFMQRLRTVVHLYRPFDTSERYRPSNRIGLDQVSEKTKKMIADVNFLDIQLYALLKARVS